MSLFRKLVGVFQAAGLSIRKRLLGGLPALYVEDVFATSVWAGNNGTGAQTIVNGVDLATYGGMVWAKNRNATGSYVDYYLADSERGVSNVLASNLQDGEQSAPNTFTSFNTDGFSQGNGSVFNVDRNVVAWTFRKQPKFFDIVTYTGNGNNRTIPHNLGSAPGCMIVKSISAAGTPWLVWHRSLTNPTLAYLALNQTATRNEAATYWNSTSPTASVFSVGTSNDVNQNGTTYVAYLWAHNAGGFGLTGNDNVISCGTFNTDSGGNCAVTLDWEPQWMLYKPANNATNWQLVDNMRGITADKGANVLAPNTDAAEQNLFGYNGVFNVNSTGFTGTSNGFYASRTYIYIAIRRGPMKVPTVGTSVFEIVARSGNNTGTTVGTSVTADATIIKCRSTISGSPFPLWADRLRGAPYFRIDGDQAEATSTALLQANPWDVQAGVKVGTGGSSTNATNANGQTYINYLFERAPNFMDVVCYTGVNSGSQSLAVSHNLAATPEMIVIRNRAGSDWFVYTTPTGTANRLLLDRDNASSATSLVSAVSSSTFTVTSAGGGNVNANTYLAFLFGTCAGVSKVGSYTGTGALQTIDCGFTSGARFVMIKRTSSTGEWYFWDSTRGITSGNDPYLLMNQAGTEVTGTNYVDTVSTGFQVTAAASAEINQNGGTFIFLAIA